MKKELTLNSLLKGFAFAWTIALIVGVSIFGCAAFTIFHFVSKYW